MSITRLDRILREWGCDPAAMDWRDLALARASVAAVIERRRVKQHSKPGDGK